MVKVIYLCDVKSCTRLAENEILLRRDKLRVCHTHSFASLRSPEYRKWKALQHPYKMPVQFSDHVPIEPNGWQRLSEQDDVEIRSPHLKIIKTFWSGPLTVL
jgi:hypothetical protein